MQFPARASLDKRGCDHRWSVIWISPAVSPVWSVVRVSAETGRTAKAKPAASVAITKPRRVMVASEMELDIARASGRDLPCPLRLLVVKNVGECWRRIAFELYCKCEQGGFSHRGCEKLNFRSVIGCHVSHPGGRANCSHMRNRPEWQ